MAYDPVRTRNEYHHQLWTVVEDILPTEECSSFVARITALTESGTIPLVDHEGVGTAVELDGGGRYLHHLFDGTLIRTHFPELMTLYRGLRYWIQDITLLDVVLSPYTDSDVNIKAYPPSGGTVGPHYDTNGITVLLYLTSSDDGPLRIWEERHDPWKGTDLADATTAQRCVEVRPPAGSMLLMQGRRVWHDSKPTEHALKAVAIFNYYWAGDIRRPGHFDDFVYRGEPNPDSSITSQ